MSGDASRRDTGLTAGWDRPKRRHLALWFPFLPAERIRRESVASVDRPLVLVERQKNALHLSATCKAAVRLGLKPGMTLADAEARHPDLDVRPAAPAADAALLERLADLCDRFSPMVAILPAIDATAALVLDVTGAAHLFGGEAAMRERAEHEFSRFGLSCRAVIAGSPDLAVALARHGGPTLVEEGEGEHEARCLPVAALRLPSRSPVAPATIAALRRAGLSTIGAVADRSAKALAARFGKGLVYQLARLLGTADARISPRRPLPPVIAARWFAEPLFDADALVHVLATLLAEAAETMEARASGARAVEAALFRTDGGVARAAVATGRPVRDPELLLRLLVERLDRLTDLAGDSSGFDGARLSVLREEPLTAVQDRLREGKGPMEPGGDTAVGDLVDRLVTWLGRSGVLAFRAGDTHDPTGEARLVPAAGISVAHLSPDALGWPAWPLPDPEGPPARPLHLFETPQPIETLAEVPDGPPLRFRWRRTVHEVVRAEGPERIAPEWWRVPANAPVRDYYRVEDEEGRRFWVFREGLYRAGDRLPCWFVHGLFA